MVFLNIYCSAPEKLLKLQSAVVVVVLLVIMFQVVVVAYARNALTYAHTVGRRLIVAADRTIKSGYRFRYFVDFMFAFCYI